MATDKQREHMDNLFMRDRKKKPRGRLYGFSEEDFIDDGGVTYLNDSELKEIAEKIKRGGYDTIG